MNSSQLKEHEKLIKEIYLCHKCEQICSDRKRLNFRPPHHGTNPSQGTRIMIVATNPGQPKRVLFGIRKFENYRYLYDDVVRKYWKGGIALFKKLGINFDEAVFTNIIKCTTAHNRIPTPEEIKNCFPFLVRQLNLIQPKIVICLGALSTKVFLRREEISLRKLSGRIFSSKSKIERLNFYVIPLYHPSYIFRQENSERDHILGICKHLKFKIREILER